MSKTAIHLRLRLKKYKGGEVKLEIEMPRLGCAHSRVGIFCKKTIWRARICFAGNFTADRKEVPTRFGINRTSASHEREVLA